MKERGKAVESYNNANSHYSDLNYSASDLLCKKHPSPSSVGICAYCLKDRLVKLVCSDCGEQRLSSCSCSEEISSSSHPDSCTVEVGSVGRISFLIENEKTEMSANSTTKIRGGGGRLEDGVLLKRSSSSCVEAKKNGGFWRFGRFFRKKREERIGGDDKSETWASDYLGVSRSRSLCSFRVGGLNDYDEGSEFSFSSAKISDYTGGFLLDSEKKCKFSGTEPRKSGFKSGFDPEIGFDLKGLKKGGILELDGALNPANRCIYPVKETDFNPMDESGFIDLKLDLLSNPGTEYSALNTKPNEEISNPGGSFGRSTTGDVVFGSGGSCRIRVSDIGIKRGVGKGNRVWKWIFRQHQSSRKKDENRILNP